MMQGTYTAALGIASQQKRLDTIANNIANIDTNGYKTSRTDFKDAIYYNMSRVEQPQDTNNMRKGVGTLVSGISRIYTPGAYKETGMETDCYINGEGFFMVQSQDGQVYYTRDGNFAKSSQADGEYLVNGNGYYVLGRDGQRIRLEGTKLEISPEGNISAGNGAEPYAALGLVTFPNQKGLTAASGNLFTASAASGQPQAAGEETTVIQKALEGSNVNLAEEFSNMIRATRALQLSSRALSMADQMDGTANSIRR